jgi:hypothetical protein
MPASRTLIAIEPATPTEAETEPPTTIDCTFSNVAATTATPENGVMSPGELPVRTGIEPVVPFAVMVSLAPMYALVFTVSTIVETAAPTLASPVLALNWPASVLIVA